MALFGCSLHACSVFFGFTRNVAVAHVSIHVLFSAGLGDADCQGNLAKPQ